MLGLSPARADDRVHLHLQFRIVDGRFAVDPASPSSTIDLPDPAQYAHPRAEVQAQFVAMLNDLLANGARVITFRGEACAEPFANDSLCDLSQSWNDAANTFADWDRAHRPGDPVPVAFLPQIFADFAGAAVPAGTTLRDLIASSAFQLDDDQSEDDVDFGRLNFTYPLGPIQDAQIAACDRAGASGCIVAFGENAGSFDGRITTGTLARSLEPLRGEVWDGRRIDRQLGDLLALIGDSSALVAAPSDNDGRLAAIHANQNPVVIDGPPRLSEIQVVLDAGDDDTAIRKILYLLLPDREYRKVEANFDAWIATRQETIENGASVELHVLSLATLGTPNCAAAGLCVPYINQRDLQASFGAIAALGYQAALWPDSNTHYDGYPDSRWARIRILPTTPPATIGVPPPAAASAPPPSAVPANKPPILESDQHHHFLSVGAGAETHQPATFFVEYRQTALTGDDAITVRAGWRDKAIISGNYTKDFVDFAGLGRRLAITVAGATDNNVGVPVGTDRADERRNGGSVTIALDAFRDLDRSYLQLTGGFSYQEVTLAPVAGAAPPPEQISSATFGASYRWLGDTTINLPDIDFEPSVTAAWGSGPTPSYWKASARGVVHDAFANFFEYDLRAGFDWASADAPRTELPRFGGEESLRGLRLNAAASTLAWYAQNEVWVPLRRITERLGPGVDGMFRNTLKLAVFVDAGGVADNLQGLPSFTAGAGVGLRYTLQDQATLRLDWAHVLTHAPPALGGSGIYFSIVLTPSRF